MNMYKNIQILSTPLAIAAHSLPQVWEIGHIISFLQSILHSQRMLVAGIALQVSLNGIAE